MSDVLIVMLALIVALPRVVRATMPYLPATIWALRVPRDSPHYRCPPLPDCRFPLSGLFRRRQD